MSNRVLFTRALSSRSFALFWSGQTISALGDGAFNTALAIEIYLLTGSTLAMGIFLTAQFIPGLIFTLIGGVVADRFPRRLLLMLVDGGRAIVVLTIACFAWLHWLQMWHLVILAVIFGFIRAFFNPAYYAIIPETVEKEQLSSANALAQLSIQMGSLLGPVLGALFMVLAHNNAGPAFTFDGITFVISVLSLLAIHTGSSRASEEPVLHGQLSLQKSRFSKMMQDIGEGFHFVRGSTWLSWSIIVPCICNAAYVSAIVVSLPKLIFGVYHGNTWILASIAMAEGCGAIIGAIVVGQFHFRHRGVVAFLGYALGGIALLCFVLPLPLAWMPFVLLVAAFILGFGLSILQTIWVTLLHVLVPSDKLGRVSSVDLVGSIAFLPVGYLLGGWMGDRFGPVSVFLFAGLLITISNVIPLLVRGIRELE